MKLNTILALPLLCLLTLVGGAYLALFVINLRFSAK